MNNEKETVLELKQICKSFRQGSQKLDVLTGVDLEIKSGEIYLNRQNCSKLGDGLRTLLRRDFLGFVYQYHNLLPDFSAEENVMLPQLIAGRKAKAARERAAWLLERLNLGSRLKHRPAEMSGGEQQRVAIARALANAPKLLLADEPTGNLDPKTSDVVFAELLNIVKETGLSALIATHNMELASAMDRKVRLEDGRLVNTGISGLISGENFY